MICDYGCGQEAKYQFNNGRWCCSENFNSCPAKRDKHSIFMKGIRKDPNSKYNSTLYKDNQSKRMKKARKDPNSKYNTILCKKKQGIKMKEAWKDLTSGLNSNSREEKKSNNMKGIWKNPNSIYNSILYRENLGKSQKLTIKKIKERYPFFAKIEEMRYNPDKPEEKEIQVHCKNHNCENSKEKGGWFTPSRIQLGERIRQLEKDYGSGGCYLYCSQHCKDVCPLYGLRNDPFKEKTDLPYTVSENQIWRHQVLELDNYKCQYCGKPATDIHHIKPVKTHPHLSLDPDNGISFCKECHYKIGHKAGTECSTGNLAKIVCKNLIQTDVRE